MLLQGSRRSQDDEPGESRKTSVYSPSYANGHDQLQFNTSPAPSLEKATDKPKNSPAGPASGGQSKKLLAPLDSYTFQQQ